MSDTQPSAPVTPRPVRMPDGPATSGHGMDRRISRAPRRWGRIAAWAIGVIVVLAVARAILLAAGGRALRVPVSHVVISDVVSGTFEDFIPVRGSVTPLKTVYLDAIEGGRVERLLVEDGADVAAGQPLVELSNTALQLDVIARETAVTEQLNTLRALELELERNRQAHERDLNDIDYDVTRLTREVERRRQLFAAGILSERDLTDAQDDMQRTIRRRDIVRDGQRRDEKLQREQLAQLRVAADQLVKNLEMARGNLDSLVVRAPIAGQLAGLEAEVGQSISAGERLGRIDAPDGFKVTADVDEFYIGRVEVGQVATMASGSPAALEISRIRPQVQGGKFGVDLVFHGEPPEGMRRGQTLQLRLTLGDSAAATLVPNGAFLADGGGAWAFVVSEDGREAVKRAIRTGRRNTAHVEIVDGLVPGERVITSSYKSYEGMDRLALAP